MKLIMLFNIFVLCLVTQSKAEKNLPNAYQHFGTVLRRHIRSTFSNLRDEYAAQLEEKIITNCKANGFDNATEELRPAIDEMKVCFQKKRLFLTPREEYLENIEDCSRESIKRTKNCLTKNQQFFPDFALAQAKSLINFFYDDFDIIRVEVVKCLPRLQNENVINSHKECIKHFAANTNVTDHRIPPSKAEFCKRFVPTAFCFTNMIKEHCDRTPGLAKYREDYIKSSKAVCEEKDR